MSNGQHQHLTWKQTLPGHYRGGLSLTGLGMLPGVATIHDCPHSFVSPMDLPYIRFCELYQCRVKHTSFSYQPDWGTERPGRQAGRHVAAPHNLSRCVIISPSIYIECDNCLDFLHKNQLRVCIILPTTNILNLFGKQTRILNLRWLLEPFQRGKCKGSGLRK